MVEHNFMQKTKDLIDNLKRICADNWLGNDGNEFKIITQVFLYKFMNDKFWHEVKLLDKKIAESDNWEVEISKYSDEQYSYLMMKMNADSARLKPEHFISSLYNRLNEDQFGKLLDDTLRDIGKINAEIFSVSTEDGTKIQLFDEITKYLVEPGKRDGFARAIINQLVEFSFEEIFHQKFDFFSTIFEYLIKDYNKDGGGKYAEYYTPHAVAKIMSAIMVDTPVKNVSCYDPSAGSGTLLMNLAHAIWEDRCTIYSQDISQKSTGLLRLNLILNNLIHSIPNIVKWNTIKDPHHKAWGKLMKFDYIVSNPPFKLDFSDYRDDLDSKENSERFFAGIPKVPNKEKDGMSIYLLFIQHIMYSLSATGRAAIVVPTGFITSQSGIEYKIREKLVESKMLRWVVSMPSNIFATTGTNVSILFLDKSNVKWDIVLVDASKLWNTIKDGKNQKTVLSPDEEQRIIDVFHNHKAEEDFSVVVSYDEIKEKNYSMSAWQFFEVKIAYNDISQEDFFEKMNTFETNLEWYFKESRNLEEAIIHQLKRIKYE